MSVKSKSLFLAAVTVLLVYHALRFQPSEPFYNGDETRHVVTGAYFKTLLQTLPLSNMHDFTIHYYLQYPALGLLVWPPLFHFLEGCAFLLFGQSIVTARLLILAFLVMASWFCFHLVEKTHNRTIAAVTVILFGLAPLVATFSRQIMLEIPTLAFMWASLFYLWTFLESGEYKAFLITVGFTVLAALTRYEALFILPVFLVIIIVRKQLPLLYSWRIAVTILAGILILAPFYYIAMREFGWFHMESIDYDVSGASPVTLVENLAYYIRLLPKQLGWPTCIAAALGLLTLLSSRLQFRSLPYVIVITITYIVFTYISEKEPRHVIYWIPAFAVFAAQGVFVIGDRIKFKRSSALLTAIVITGTFIASWMQKVSYLYGYEQAAEFILSNLPENERRCLFDGELEGNFIFQVSRLDDQRRLWILRGDKLFYSYLMYPSVRYTDYVQTAEDIKQVIYDYDPQFIVLEEPRPLANIATAELLRDVIHSNPDRYELVATIPVKSNHNSYENIKLNIYHNLFRNAHPVTELKIEMLSLDKQINTVMP